MKGYYDLHVHSCLSPCGDEEMTPGNIVGMAQILGLSILAVADHNTARQLPAVDALCREAGILFVPGIEISAAEEAHILCLFPDLPSALAMGEEAYAALPPVKNRPDIQELSGEITRGMEIVFVSSMEEVLERALV